MFVDPNMADPPVLAGLAPSEVADDDPNAEPLRAGEAPTSFGAWN